MDKNLTVGDVIGGTLAMVSENRQAVLLFVTLITVIATAIEWGLTRSAGAIEDDSQVTAMLLAAFGVGAGLSGILIVIAGVVVSYLLWEAMLRRAGIESGDRGRRFFAYFFQAILIAIAAGFGFVLLIVPGLIFMARWAAAPAYLIVERQGIIEAMRSSWKALRGNTTPVVLAILVAVIVFAVLALIVGATVGLAGLESEVASLPQILLTQLVSAFSSVLGVALGVFLFKQLHSSSEALSEVFE